MTIAPHGAAQKPNKPPKCSALDGVYHHDEGWNGRVAAPGISIASFEHDRVVFDVAEGFALGELCVTTARDNDVYRKSVV